MKNGPLDSEVTLKAFVKFTYYAGCPGCNYLRNGDPGYPPESPEIDILSIKLIDSDDAPDITSMLPEESLEAIQDELLLETQESLADEECEARKGELDD